MNCKANQIDASNWALSITGIKSRSQENKVALHYVIDNSTSMGRTTKDVQDIFSKMVDTVATAPCSMTVFAETGAVLSSHIIKASQMRSIELPSQGCTNIPDGVEKALEVVSRLEKESKAELGLTKVKTHHILILLSDGKHNVGEDPRTKFPKLENVLPDGVKLSIVVVGYSMNSDTSMGMLLKNSVETVAFDTQTVQTVYFAKSKAALLSTLTTIESALNNALNGSFHEVETRDNALVENFHIGATSKLQVHLAPGVHTLSLLYCAEKAPDVVVIDGDNVEVTTDTKIQMEHLSRLIQNLIDKTRVQVVAARNSTAIAQKSVQRLNAFIKILDAEYYNNNDREVRLNPISPKERIKQYRTTKAVCHGAKVLRNQVLDIANFSNQNSEVSADFLNGRSMKFANKALRRAAKTADKVVDPVVERKAMLKELTSSKFSEKLGLAMSLDALSNLLKLSDYQFKYEFLPVFEQTSRSDITEVQKLRKKLKHEAEVSKEFVYGLSHTAERLLTSGKISECLNKVFHGNRFSYISLSSIWQHIEDWKHFNEQEFDSTWEMLMYAGFVGYPIVIDRSSSSQMNPFLMHVSKVNSSLADSASVCCANQAEIPVYGPEGGRPVKDIMILVDPSMPRSSKLICSSELLGKKHTSAVVARDLHMYTGFSMQIAVLSNSLYHLIAVQKKVTKEEVVDSIRRSFQGRAFMCSSCKFGPVDHFNCSDLLTHHGEKTSNRGNIINNACPNCGWFSKDLSDWDIWDGKVCHQFIASELDSTANDISRTNHLIEAEINLVLRILYSFQHLATSSVKKEYSGFASRMLAGSVPDWSEKTGIDGMSQILMAILTANSESSIINALTLECLISVIEEACKREVRQKFRIKSGGDKVKAKDLAIEFVSSLLGVDACSAPYTRSQMEPEPPTQNIRQDCDDTFQINDEMSLKVITWVRKIAKQWCRAWSFARGFHDTISRRKGSWNKVEIDMETGIQNYVDVIDSLKNIEFQNPQDLFNLDPTENMRFLLSIGVGAIFSGVLEKPIRGNVLYNGEDILHEAAREMRMVTYYDRVHKKFVNWKQEGELRVYHEAIIADIAQFEGMINVTNHVHGLDKQTFWGLWTAAKNTQNPEKISSFLATACESFKYKHT